MACVHRLFTVKVACAAAAPREESESTLNESKIKCNSKMITGALADDTMVIKSRLRQRETVRPAKHAGELYADNCIANPISISCLNQGLIMAVSCA